MDWTIANACDIAAADAAGVCYTMREEYVARAKAQREKAARERDPARIAAARARLAQLAELARGYQRADEDGRPILVAAESDSRLVEAERAGLARLQLRAGFTASGEYRAGLVWRLVLRFTFGGCNWPLEAAIGPEEIKAALRGGA